MIKNTLQYRIEHNIGLTAWKYHIQSLLFSSMTTYQTLTSSDHTSTNNIKLNYIKLNCD